MTIEPQWTDYNGHLNMAYYNVLFDRGGDQFFDALGIGSDYAKTRRLTIYTAEIHVCYLKELHQGAQVIVATRLLEHDEKRLRLYQEIRHSDGWLAATSEALSLHIDMSGPKVTPFPADRLAVIQNVQTQHNALPLPDNAGKGIRLINSKSNS